jgi:LCP family protein required for cell wall assembly
MNSKWGKIVIVLLFVVAIGFGGYKGVQVNKAVKKMNASAVVSFAKMNESQLSGYNLTSDDNVKNILLVGSDKRGSESGYGRADCILIATIDSKNNQLKLTSLLGDSYVEIPEHGENRLSMAYSIGGISLLYETIASNYEIRLDNYAAMEFKDFVGIIDQIGGVTIDVSEFEARYLQQHYTNTAGDVAIGTNKLNGTQALAYVRIKQDAASDFGRCVRARKVVKAVYSSMTGTAVSNLVPTVEQLLDAVQTDIDSDTMKEYLASVISKSTSELMQKTIPQDSDYEAQSVDETTVYRVDVEACKSALLDFIYNPVEQSAIDSSEEDEGVQLDSSDSPLDVNGQDSADTTAE